MNIPESHKQTFHLMPFECHFLVALMTLAGQTDARTWARGSLPDVFIRFSQRPLGQAAIPLTLTCGCELAKWDGWDRHPLKQKSHSPAHTCEDRRAPPSLSHTLHHVIYLMLIQPQHTHVAAQIRPCVLVKEFQMTSVFSPPSPSLIIFCSQCLCRPTLSLNLYFSLSPSFSWKIKTEEGNDISTLSPEALFITLSLSPTDS